MFYRLHMRNTMSQRLPFRTFALCLLAVAVLSRTPAAWAEDVKRPEPPPAKEKPKKPGELKKYAEVITADARTTAGVFTVHRVDDKVYYEIPADAYGKLMLWMTEVAKAPAGVGWGGSALGSRIVHWERRHNKVFLWLASFEKHGDGKAVQRAVDSATFGSIVMSFPVEAEGKDRAAVINVTRLFTTDVPEFSARRLVGPGAHADDARSYIEEVKAFPTNIETRSLLTFQSTPGGAAGPGPAGRVAVGGIPRSVSVLVHYSMTLLPEHPMQGRYFDPRVGFFTQPFEDYTSPKNWVVENQYISRYRLDKKDPKAAVSEPVKPIVFYISREVPEKWRPYVKKGVEDWQPAFEKAGFKKAILCREAPSAEDDPSWDPEDARYSVIRWVAMPIKNAMGPHVHDPRSGEIVSAHIIMWHDLLKLVQEWYFVQCAAIDPRARQLPLPDDLTGQLVQQVVTHEVGHTLGLRHNHRASSAYTIAQLRDPQFCERHGTTASIMSYGRYNYVAQPEDNVKWLIPKVGPYDVFAIDWGYKPIANASSPEAEKPTLDKWAARQLEEPWLRFGGEDGPAIVDPTVKTENIGDDPLQATALGLKNVDRVLDILVPATSKVGEDEALLKETYQSILSHRANWLRSVATMVGGVVENRALGHRNIEAFQRVPRDRQQEAVKFLLDNAFTTPKKLLQPALVNRFKYFGVADEVMNQQRALLDSLLNGRRFQLLMDEEIAAPDQAYPALEFLTDVQDGVWKELKTQHPTMDACRRHLQRAYLDYMKKELDPKATAAQPGFPGGDDTIRLFTASNRETDFRAVARAALRELAERLDTAVPKARDAMTRAHLQDCRREVEQILNPKQ
jgi:hypothetical protein